MAHQNNLAPPPTSHFRLGTMALLVDSCDKQKTIFFSVVELCNTYVIYISLRQKDIVCVCSLCRLLIAAVFISEGQTWGLFLHTLIQRKRDIRGSATTSYSTSILGSHTFSYIFVAPVETFRHPLSKRHLETEGETTALSVRSVIRASRAACCFVPHTNAELSEWSARSREWNESNFSSLQ